MKILDFAAAPNPLKLRLYCAEKDLAIPFEHIDLKKGEHKSPAFMEKNPLGTVPILALDNGAYLIESLVIMEYLEELYPEPCMIGRTPLERAYTRQAERFIEWHIFYNVIQVFFHTSAFFSDRQQVSEIAEAAKVRLLPALEYIDSLLNKADFVVANRPTIADCTLFAAFIHAKRIGIDLSDECKNIRRWYIDFSRRNSASV